MPAHLHLYRLLMWNNMEKPIENRRTLIKWVSKFFAFRFFSAVQLTTQACFAGVGHCSRCTSDKNQSHGGNGRPTLGVVAFP